MPDVRHRSRLFRAERVERARHALAQVTLDLARPDLLPRQLSVGRCQRVAIARALIVAPALIVADEPTASLDVTTAAEIVTLLRAITERGTALLVVSHDLLLLRALTERTVQLDHGHVVTIAPAGALP